MMGALLNLMRNLKRRGLRMMLVGLNPSIRGTFSVTHLDRLFEVYDTEEEARGAMRRHARL
jgi:anti-anti-sigma factor